MNLSDIEIKKIAEMISSRLGPSANPDEIRKLAAQVIERLSEADKKAIAALPVTEPVANPSSLRIAKKLIVNALGPDKGGLSEKLKSFVAGRALRLLGISDTRLENLRSLIAIIDCSNYSADISRLKFEISSLCEEIGFKAIIQDSNYYGL